MAVESRFVVIRHGVEAKTFMDKKSADEYDKMLDMADNLADIFAQSPLEISENTAEELSIYLAQHRDDVLVALLAKKAAKKVEKKIVEENNDNITTTSATNDDAALESPQLETKTATTKSKATKLTKAAKNKSVKKANADVSLAS